MLTIPAKIMLIGEIAVVRGGKAVVMPLAKKFELLSKKNSKLDIHKDSPAGQLLKKYNFDPQNLKFNDPFDAQGGFGRSTAEYLALQQMIDPTKTIFEIWQEYRSFWGGLRSTPSGADLVCQGLNEAVVVDPSSREIEKIDLTWIRNQILVFSATHQEQRKTKTHVFLESISERKIERLNELKEKVDLFLKGNSEKDISLVSQAINEFAEICENEHLEVIAAKEDREAILELDGVLAVKGCGANLSDSLIVLIKKTAIQKYLISEIEKRNLKYVV